MDTLFEGQGLTSTEVKEIAEWLEEKSYSANSYRLYPEDQYVKAMMRRVDSLRAQGEYNLDAVDGRLFGRLREEIMYARKKYRPRVAFSSCVVMRGTYGSQSPLLELDDTGYVLWWFKNQRPYELFVTTVTTCVRS